MRASRQLVWTLALVALATTIYLVIRARRDLVDFEVYRTAAVRVLAGETIFRPDDGHWQFKYLPAFAVVTAPLAWIDPEVGKALWFGASCVLVVWIFKQSVALLPNRRRRVTTLVALGAFLTAKLWIKELAMGQTNLWLVLLVLLALGVLSHDGPPQTASRRRATAGALIGAAVFVKPYALIFIPWLFVAGGLSAIGGCAVALVAGLALPAVAYGWHGDVIEHIAWWRTVSETTAPNLLFPENVSIAAMWAKWIGIGRPASVLALLTAATVLTIVLSVFIRRARVGQPSYLEVAALMAIIPIVSPQGWDYLLLLGIPATILLLDRWRDVTVAWRAMSGAAIVVAGFTLYDLLGRSLYLRAMSWSVLTLATIVLAICVVHLRWRELA